MQQAYSVVNHIFGLPVTFKAAHSVDLPIFEKLPAIVADLGIAGVAYGMARRFVAAPVRLALVAAYLFSPAAIYDSAIWGQTDAIFTLCLLAALWAIFEQRSAVGGLLFGLALMLKPQPLVFAPLMLLILYRDGFRALVKGVDALLGVCLLLFLPYLIPPDELFAFLDNTSGSIAHIASDNAFNLWWAFHLETFPSAQPLVGPLSPSVIGWALLLAVMLLAGYSMWRKPSTAVVLVGFALVADAFFLFTTAQHERYQFPVMGLLLLAAIVQRRNWIWYGLTSLFVFLNIALIGALHTPLTPFDRRIAVILLFHDWITQVIAGANVVVFCVMVGFFVQDVFFRTAPQVAETPQMAAPMRAMMRPGAIRAP
jgi:dolichyl-phosphate-mannose-protein mannosyltransferase